MLPNVEQWIASLRQYGLFSPQPDSPLDPREFQTSLKENTRRFLFPIFLLLALHYLAITAFRLVYLPDEHALHLLFLSTVPLLFFMGLAIWVKKHTLQIHRLYPVMTFAFLVLLLECTLHLHITQEPFQSTNFALIILGIGCLFLSLPWFIFNLALVFLAWASASYAFSPTLFFHYFFMLFASTLLAGIVFVSRYRSALHKYQVIHQLSLAHQSLKHRAEEVEQSTREIQTQIKERQKYEFLLRQFIHNAPAPIAMLDRQFNILLYSKRWIEDFQLPEKDLSGQSLDQIFSHIPTQWKNALNNALLGEMFSCEEDRFFRPEGKTEWIRWEIRPWRQADGSIGGAVMFVELITEQKQAETSLQHSNHLLQALTNAQANFITHVEPRALFNDLLRNLLDLTQSEYGFIGEVLHTNTGAPYLKTYSISNIAWNKETLDFYEDNMPNGLEFHNMNTLFGWVITHKATMISNNPSADFRAGGLPGGHPPLRAFLGIPFFGGDKMIGMIGIANRPGGYNEDIVNYLQPFLATCSNIIEAHKNNQRRETAEKALRDSEAKIRTILDNVVDAIVTIDESGAITSVNPAVETTFGYRPEELIGRNVNILMPSPFAEEHGQYITNYLQSGIRKVIGYGREAVAKRKDGSTFPIDLAVSEMDLEGRQNFIGILRDITERKEAEEHLTRISKAVESSSDAIFLGDKDGIPIYLNHAFIKRFGYSLHELLEQDLQSLFVHSNVKSKMQGLLHNNLTWNSEEEMRTKNGDMLTVDLRMDSIHDETGKVLGIIGILTDITKRKLTERALEERVVFEQFVTTISTKFINLPVHKIDSGIHDAIKAIGEYTGADRCLIFLYSDNLEYIEEVFEWGASNTPSVKEQFIGVHSNRYPWWNQQIRNKEFVYVRNTNQLPPEAEAEKATLASINATSLIAVPLMQDRDMIGFFGFHSIGREQDWTVDTILLLKILGEIFVNAIKRKKAENALRKSEESLQDFLDNANDLIQSVSPDGKFIYVNRAWQEALGYTEKEASQLTIFDIIHPESMDHCKILFQQVLQGENLLGLETKFLTKS
ncbi:PAS domain S-box protein, partial [bacterium]|nr:PAS domain S-box protein [bacterium]